MSPCALLSAMILARTFGALTPRCRQTSSRVSSLSGPQNTQRQATAALYSCLAGSPPRTAVFPARCFLASHLHSVTVWAITPSKKSFHACSASTEGLHSLVSSLT